MKRSWSLCLLLAVVPALGAQQRPGPPDSARMAELRAEVERRFGEHVRRELGLTDDQAAKLRATQDQFGARRREIGARQRALRLALEAEMRPGVAANPDSVRKLLDAIQAGRAQMLALEQEEDREMAGYLTPVQRAQFQMLRQRFAERVQELRRERPRPGMRPRPEGPRRRPQPGTRRPGRPTD